MKVKKTNLCLCLSEKLALNGYGGLDLHIEACLTSTVNGGAAVNVMPRPFCSRTENSRH